VVVADRPGEVHRDPAEGVDDLAEAVEVDQQVVVDGDVQALLDGLDQLAGAVVEGRVDLGRPVGAGDGDVQVAAWRAAGTRWTRMMTSLRWPAASPNPPSRRPWRVSEPTTSRLTDPSEGDLPRPGTWTELIWPNRKAV
jgi:hypothetical protein